MNCWMSRTKPLRSEYLEVSMGHKGRGGNISKEALFNLAGTISLSWTWVITQTNYENFVTSKNYLLRFSSFHYSSVAQSCQTLCDPMNCSTPGLPVHHQLPEFTLTHVHWVGDAIQPSHPLSSPSPPAPNPSQHQGLFQWVNSSHQGAIVLEIQLQHQSFQWTPRTDLL